MADAEQDPLVIMLSDPDIKAAYLEKLYAETRQADATAVHELAQAATQDQATKTGIQQVVVAEIMARTSVRDEQEHLAKNKYHQVYVFGSEVGAASTGACIEQLTAWSRTNPKCDIEIVFNSPGGSVISGLALFDYIQQIKRAGHKVTTSAIGHAASMAGILVQAGDVRVIGKESWLLIHEISFAAIGKIGEVEDTTDWVKRIQKRVINIFCERSKLTPARIEKRWKRADWWISSDEALAMGLVDEIR